MTAAGRPPRLAERLLSWTLAADDRDVVLGDLLEEFGQRTREDGARAARRWYWRQVRRSIVSNVRGRWEVARVPRAVISASRIGAGSALARDVRDGARALCAAPRFTVVALLVLALGIGTSTTIFSVVDAVVFRPLPLAHSDRLMVVGQVRTDRPLRNQAFVVAPQDYVDWSARQDVFDGFAAWASADTMTLQGSQPESLRAIRATASLFSTLLVHPARGAFFTAANEIAGADHVAVISDGFWRRRFDADPDIVGRTMTIDGSTWDIVGVAPPEFTYPLGRVTDAWIPFVVPPSERVRSDHYSAYLQVIGRLRAGASVADAEARMELIRADLARQFPAWFRNGATRVRPLRDTIVGSDVQSWMLMLMAAVAFVLLIACVNVASLMLARASTRAREMSVRAALGASRWQLVRGVLVESLLLSATGTGCGVVGAYWGVGALRAALPASLPRSADIAVNWRVLAAAAAAAVVTGLVCGMLPAIQASRLNLTRALRDGGRSGTAARGRQRLRAILVGGEVGLAIVLLVGAGLFISSFVRLTSVDLGLDYRHVLTLGLTPRVRGLQTPADRAATSARVSALVNDVLPLIRQIPGVQSAAALSGTRPLEGGHDRTNVTVRGHEQDFRGADDQVDVYRITADYPAVIGVTLLRGRLFRADDNAAGARVALLNDTAAARYFPGVDPIGQTIGIAGDRTVVGILHSVRAGGPETDVRPEAYLPFSHDDAPFAYLVVRTTGDPATLAPAVKGAIWSAAPGLPLADVQTLEEFLGRLVAPWRFNMLLIGLFGALALAIASVGIYGVMAYVVEQRTAEIGIRMALGARPGEVIGMILWRALVILSGGLVIGLAIAWPFAQTLRAFLFHVQPHDIVVYAAASIVLLGAGLAAAFGPARRASRVDPVIALRAD